MSEGRTSVYQIVTDRIVAALEKGTVPWHRPWRGGHAGPRNLVSKKPYRGVNYWLLSIASGDDWFVTFKQARALGGYVKKDEKGLPVVFWKFFDKETMADGTIRQRPPVPFYHTVFGLSQCGGIEFSKAFLDSRKPEAVLDPIAECEAVVKGMPNAPTMHTNGTRAYYRPADDSVTVPPLSMFDSAEEYYSTTFHELAHSTGHKSRLSREGIVEETSHFGSQKYSFEELVAELSASYLCAITGIENKTIDNSASYIASWLKKFKSDPKMIVQASSKAQKAADYILNVKWEKPVEEESEVTA